MVREDPFVRCLCDWCKYNEDRRCSLSHIEIEWDAPSGMDIKNDYAPICKNFVEREEYDDEFV